MTQQLINLGSAANAHDGDSLRTGGQKANENFSELYKRVALLTFSTGNATAAANASTYLGVAIALSGANEDGAKIPIPFAGIIDKLDVQALAAPGGTDTFTYTLRKNGVDTALTCTVTGSAKVGADGTHAVTFSAGDRASIKVAVSATGAATNHTAACRVTGA